MSEFPEYERQAIALDVGDARIGIAGADPTGLIATPLDALERTTEADDVERILQIAREQNAGRIVVGLPLSLDGSRGPQARKVLRFTEALRAAAELPVESWDERYSTAEAERLLRAAGEEPSRNRARLDSVAAAVILQAYLDAHRNT